MSKVGQKERQTQTRVIKLLREQLGYDYLGNWIDYEDNHNIMEGLLLDETGYVIGGTMTNLLALRGRVLYTPDLSSSGIAGVTRERILAYALGLGLSIKITQLSLSDLFEADEVMLCNSVIGVWQVRELRHKQWQKGQYVALFRSLLEADDD